MRDGDDFIITGHKGWTSRIEESDLALVLARTSEKPDGKGSDKTHGLTLFLVDLRQVRAEQPDTLKVVKVRTMFNYATNFRYVIDGWNAERILLASEAIGDGYWFTRRGVDYANSREVFGRKIGANQGVQFPITDAYMKVRAADMMRYEAARLFDAGEPCGAEANMAKHLASEASWAAANACLDTHGGYGFVDEYDVGRKFRETRMFQVAPVNNNLIKSFVATKVLGLPRSY
ncbi:alkylation response protein AidB-like acyl-CoA dehydrogenase [Arthrobacter sp. UYEF20]